MLQFVIKCCSVFDGNKLCIIIYHRFFKSYLLWFSKAQLKYWGETSGTILIITIGVIGETLQFTRNVTEHSSVPGQRVIVLPDPSRPKHAHTWELRRRLRSRALQCVMDWRYLNSISDKLNKSQQHITRYKQVNRYFCQMLAKYTRGRR